MKPTVSREADQLINAQRRIYTTCSLLPMPVRLSRTRMNFVLLCVCVKIASDVRPLSIRIGSDPREEEEALGSRAIKLGLPHVIVTPSIIAARDASYEHGVWLLGQAGIMEHQKMWYLRSIKFSSKYVWASFNALRRALRGTSFLSYSKFPMLLAILKRRSPPSSSLPSFPSLSLSLLMRSTSLKKS